MALVSLDDVMVYSPDLDIHMTHKRSIDGQRLRWPVAENKNAFHKQRDAAPRS